MGGRVFDFVEAYEMSVINTFCKKIKEDYTTFKTRKK